MIQTFVDGIVQLLRSTNMSNWLVVLLISFLPFSESRLGIPIGMRLGLTQYQSFLFAFVGSSLAIPIVFIFCVPLLDKMVASKGFSKIAKFFKQDFQSHANKIDNTKGKSKNSQLRRMIAVILFVAMPGPLTGVWAGTAVASILRLSFSKSIVAVTLGNLIASLLVLLFSDIFAQHIDIVIFILLVLTAAAVLLMIARLIIKYFKKTLST